MTIIEVVQSDGSTQVYKSEERSTDAIAKEVDQLYPDATLWRKSYDWRAPGTGRPLARSIPMLSAAKIALAILALALILTPVVTWIVSSNAIATPLQAQLGADEDSLDDTSSTTVTLPATPPPLEEAVQIVNEAVQVSDTTLTVRVLLRNSSLHSYEDIKLQATFYAPSGAEIAEQETSQALISLGPDEEGYVKVWAHGDDGIETYELELLQ